MQFLEQNITLLGKDETFVIIRINNKLSFNIEISEKHATTILYYKQSLVKFNETVIVNGPECFIFIDNNMISWMQCYQQSNVEKFIFNQFQLNTKRLPDLCQKNLLF